MGMNIFGIKTLSPLSHRLPHFHYHLHLLDHYHYRVFSCKKFIVSSNFDFGSFSSIELTAVSQDSFDESFPATVNKSNYRYFHIHCLVYR